jgi:hypothetical protein
MLAVSSRRTTTYRIISEKKSKKKKKPLKKPSYGNKHTSLMASKMIFANGM